MWRKFSRGLSHYQAVIVGLCRIVKQVKNQLIDRHQDQRTLPPNPNLGEIYSKIDIYKHLYVHLIYNIKCNEFQVNLNS